MNPARTAIGLGVLLWGCAPSEPPPSPKDAPAGDGAVVAEEPPKPGESNEVDAPPPTPESSAMQSFRATVEIDPKPGGKKFQGVWLVTDSERRVISYRPHPWWRAFEGRTVDVKGEPYQPEGQAIGAPHFRISEMRVVDPKAEDSLVMIRGKKEWTGKFEARGNPPGSKLEGETTLVFRADGGGTFLLSNLPEPAPALDASVTVVGHEVEPSPFAARQGGRYLWVVDVKTP